MEIDDLTEKVIGCAYAGHNELGTGFQEKVYENALKIELEETGIEVQQQFSIPVHYRNHLVGDYYADLLVEDGLILELKAIRNLLVEHEVQLVAYLAAIRIDNGLLINFGPSVQVKRKHRQYRESLRSKNEQ